MLFRLYAISMMLLIVLQGTAGAHGGIGMLCLGGGNQSTIKQDCVSGCDHDAFPLPANSHEHGHQCDCIDVSITFVNLRSLQHDDVGTIFGRIHAPADDWRRIALVTASCATGPPEGYRLHHGTDATMLVIKSTRILI